MSLRRTEAGADRSGDGTFDLVILGSGSTAFAAALRAAELGKTAAMSESRVLGGTCVNRGCLPSKSLLAAAEAIHDARHPRFAGICIPSVEVDVRALIRQKNDLVGEMRERKYRGVADASERITVFEGRARVCPDGTVEVDGTRLRGRSVLIATGSRPFVPPLEGLDRVPYLTSDLLSATEPEGLDELPASVLIVGGGYIACELGQAFARLGCRVTLLERSETLLRGFEPEVGQEVREFLSREGIEILLGADARSIRPSGAGVVIVADHEGRPRELRADALLLATGRVPNTDGIGLQEAGIDLDEHGRVRVDQELRTSRPAVWAAGDVVAGPMATPVGAHEGALAADNALRNAGRRVDRKSVPRAVFTDPAVATVGMTEQQAVEQGLSCWCRTVSLSHVPRAAAIHKTAGFVKIVAERGSERVVGVTMVGSGAAEVVHEAAMALRFGAVLGDLIDQIHIYPTMAEALKIAALAFRKDITRLSCCAE